jgi:hypothetical protein
MDRILERGIARSSVQSIVQGKIMQGKGRQTRSSPSVFEYRVLGVPGAISVENVATLIHKGTALHEVLQIPCRGRTETISKNVNRPIGGPFWQQALVSFTVPTMAVLSPHRRK